MACSVINLIINYLDLFSAIVRHCLLWLYTVSLSNNYFFIAKFLNTIDFKFLNSQHIHTANQNLDLSPLFGIRFENWRNILMKILWMTLTFLRRRHISLFVGKDTRRNTALYILKDRGLWRMPAFLDMCLCNQIYCRRKLEQFSIAEKNSWNKFQLWPSLRSRYILRPGLIF